MDFTVLFAVVVLLAQVSFIHGEISHILQQQHEAITRITAGPPVAYAYSYSAGHAPGNFDRTHTEVSDGSGLVRGTFAYVDPKNQGRTIDNVIDQNGFHPEDTEANKLATQKHFKLYNQIAAENANAHFFRQQYYEPQSHASDAIRRATNIHLDFYEKTAQQHSAIGAAHSRAIIRATNRS